jgi:hypothetical protein
MSTETSTANFTPTEAELESALFGENKTIDGEHPLSLSVSVLKLNLEQSKTKKERHEKEIAEAKKAYENAVAFHSEEIRKCDVCDVLSDAYRAGLHALWQSTVAKPKKPSQE